MKRWNPFLSTALLFLLVHPSLAQQADDDSAAVSRRVESYVAAFNRRDVPACADYWSESAEYLVAGAAQPIVGREAIGQALEKLLATDEQFQLSASGQRFRSVAGNVVIEEGTARLDSETHGVEFARYLAVHVKQNGTWYRDSIRETLIGRLPASAPQSQDLEPLIGTWNLQSDEGTMTIQSNWMQDKRFISRSFELQDKKGHKTTATEIIGWDPASQVIRSWSFDSQGGFEQAVWSRDGDQWLIKASAVLPDGSTATEQRSLNVDSDGNLKSQIIEQQFGGRLLPGTETVTLVRTSS